MTARVSHSEAQLLELTAAICRGHGAAPWLHTRFELAPAQSPAAMDTLKQLLATGCSRAVIAGGGWRRTRRPQGHRMAQGRLWERHRLEGLTFTAGAFDLLTTLLTTDGNLQKRFELPGTGDHVLGLLVARALHRAELPLEPVADVPLVQLCFHLDLDTDGLRDRLWLVDAFQDTLADELLDALNRLGTITDPAQLAHRCLRIDRTLHAFIDLLDAEERRDLADFVIEVARRWFPNDRDWLPPLVLDERASLRDRTEARRAMVTFPGLLLRLGDRIHADRAVNFFEDGYEAAQARLERWERLGNERIAVIRTVVERLSA